MGLFDNKKRGITRRELREILRRAPSVVPGVGGRRYSEKERVALEKEIFGREYGEEISQRDFKDAIEKLRKNKYKLKTMAERLELEHKIKFLEHLEKM